MQVHHRKGIYLPQSGLWLDPHTAQETAVVSHAHSDHVKAHGRVLTSSPTAAMMQLRGTRRCEFQRMLFNEPVEIGGAQLTLLSAGHILGSSQVLVEHENKRLLYSGDFKLREGLSAEVIEVPTADILIMETTFGLPRYRFPDREDVMQQIIDFCRRSLLDGCTPVVFCYSLGKGQEVLAGLKDVEFPIYLHSKHFEMANLYRHFGVDLPPYQLYQAGQKSEGAALDGVLLCASGCRRGTWFNELSCVRTAYISGWAADKRAKWRFGTDAAFPLSDHADYDELLEYVERVGPRQIYTMHGFDVAFSADLRSRGYQAQPLFECPPAPEQKYSSARSKPKAIPAQEASQLLFSF